MIYQRNYFFPVMTSCFAYEKLDPHMFLTFPFPSGNVCKFFSQHHVIVSFFKCNIYGCFDVCATCVPCLWRPEEDFGSPGTGVVNCHVSAGN